MLSRSKQREQIRRRYRALRAAVGLNQYETAERADITQNRYWRIENGWIEPTAEEAASLAKVFRVPARSEVLAS